MIRVSFLCFDTNPNGYFLDLDLYLLNDHTFFADIRMFVCPDNNADDADHQHEHQSTRSALKSSIVCSSVELAGIWSSA